MYDLGPITFAITAEENVAPGIPVTPESLEAHAEWMTAHRGVMAGITLAREAKRLRAELDARKGEEAELAVLAHKLRARAPIWTESPGSEDVIAEVDWLAVARIVRDHFREGEAK